MPVVRVSLPPASAYSQTPVYSVDENIVFGLLQPPATVSANDSQITITERFANRLDRVASEAIGDERYWWAVALANNIVDPLTECSVGRVLRVPNRRVLT
jgi:hypothetical protein